VSRLKTSLPDKLAASVKATMAEWQTGGKVKRLWQKDASLWTGSDEASWFAVRDLLVHNVEPT